MATILLAVRAFLALDIIQRIGMAMLEVFCVGIIGVIPLFAAPFLKIDDPTIGLAGATAAFSNLINLGQLFLYSFAFAGTLMWLLFARSGGAHVFFRVALGLVAFVVCIISVAVFMQNPSMTHKLPDHIVLTSISCFLLSLAVYFFLLLCESASPPTPRTVFDRDVADIIKKVEARAK